jgi:hypothetical protein
MSSRENGTGSTQLTAGGTANCVKKAKQKSNEERNLGTFWKKKEDGRTSQARWLLLPSQLFT